MFQLIIVPLDGSEEATLATGPAYVLARRLGVPVRVLALSKAHEDPTEIHDALVAQLGPTGDLPRVIDVVPIRRSVAEDIRELAAQNASALIVMASHGHGRLAAVVGSVANDILAHAEQAVLLVGPASIPGRFRTDGPALVCVFGDDDRMLLDTTAEFLHETDFDPVVMHVTSPGSAHLLDLAHRQPGDQTFRWKVLLRNTQHTTLRDRRTESRSTSTSTMPRTPPWQSLSKRVHAGQASSSWRHMPAMGSIGSPTAA